MIHLDRILFGFLCAVSVVVFLIILMVFVRLMVLYPCLFLVPLVLGFFWFIGYWVEKKIR